MINLNLEPLNPEPLPELIPASFSARSMALLIDAAILGCLHLAVSGVAGVRLSLLLPADLRAIMSSFALFFCLLFSTPLPLAMAYFTIFHAWGGQTPGKLCLGIRVVAVAGGSLSAGTAFLRFAGYLVSLLPAAAGFLWAVLDREQRAWHDHLAGSRVIVGEPAQDPCPKMI